MAQDVGKIAALYDGVAKEYAEHFAGEHEKKPLDVEVLRRFAALVGDEAPVWDIGCGPGQTTRYLRDLGLKISGLDLSPKLVSQARLGNSALTFVQGDMLALDFDDCSVAAIVSFYSIVHFTMAQVRRAFSEFHRVLDAGGFLLLTFHIGEETLHVKEFLGKAADIEFMLFTTEQIVEALTEVGFECSGVIEREPYPDVEYQSRRAYVFAKKR